jgi:ankyrin repeat protein
MLTPKAMLYVILLKTATFVNTSLIQGWTPLMSACDRGHETVVDILLHSGANPNHADHKVMFFGGDG